MSKIAPNFGRTTYTEPVAVEDTQNVPENVAGLRFDATALIVVSSLIAFVAPPLGAGGIIWGLLWLLASAPATVTTNHMASELRAGDKAGGCGWYVATLLIGAVAFGLGLAVIAAMAMAGR